MYSTLKRRGKRLFPRHFNVKYMRCVCRVLINWQLKSVLWSSKIANMNTLFWFCCQWHYTFLLLCDSYKNIGVLKNVANLTGKHMRPATLLKKRLRCFQHRCFLINFVKFLRTPTYFTKQPQAIASILLQLKNASKSFPLYHLP